MLHLCLVDSSKPTPKRWKAALAHDANGAFGQIDLKAGDVVDEVERKGDWIVVRTADGQEGAVPSAKLGNMYKQYFWVKMQ